MFSMDQASFDALSSRPTMRSSKPRYPTVTFATTPSFPFVPTPNLVANSEMSHALTPAVGTMTYSGRKRSVSGWTSDSAPATGERASAKDETRTTLRPAFP